jgi:hypothetical protein
MLWWSARRLTSAIHGTEPLSLPASRIETRYSVKRLFLTTQPLSGFWGLAPSPNPAPEALPLDSIARSRWPYR